MIHRQNSPTLPVGDLAIYACTAFGIALLVRGLVALVRIPLPENLGHTVWLACVLIGLLISGGLVDRVVQRASKSKSDSDHRVTPTPRRETVDLQHRHAR